MDSSMKKPRSTSQGSAEDLSRRAIQETGDIEALSDPEGRLVVELLPDGRMRAPAQTTREMLRDRLRYAEVLPTGPGWAVLRGLAPSPDAPVAGGREVVAAGAIGETGISLIDFIGFLATGYQSGMLEVASGEVERCVYLYQGDVVWASSTAPEDRLGEFLLARGKITREQLNTVTAREADKQRIGRSFVDRGIISARELWQMMQSQLTEIFDKLLAAETGVWAFSRVPPETLSESQIHLSTQGLLVDALRRFDELQVYRQRIRSGDVLIQRVRREHHSAASELLEKLEEPVRAEALGLLDRLSSEASVRELMRALGKGEFEVTRLVYHLLRANLVEIVHANETGPIPRRAAVTKTEVREVLNIYTMAIREMFDEVARLGKDAPLRSAAREFLEDEAGSGAYAQFLKNVRILPDGNLDDGALLAGMESVGLTVQELSDVLSELLFFVLFQATELLGRRRGDDLARRVKMIHGLLSQVRPEGA